MEISTSLAAIVKSNNGFFKSPKQAEFLLRQCDGGVYVASGSVYGNGYQIWYTCDDDGVVKVEKTTTAKGLQLQWERRMPGVIAIQDSKEFKRLTRLRKQRVSSMKDRQASFDAGIYPSVDLFEKSQARDLQAIVDIDEALSTI